MFGKQTSFGIGRRYTIGARTGCPAFAVSFSSVKRLTILPHDKSSEREPELAIEKVREPDPARSEERRRQARVERRLDQRRKAIARRVVRDRRIAARLAPDTLFADSRLGIERRMTSARRKQRDRRAGVRKIDLTNLDLSELDH
jgi:hypothetical protein